MPRNKSKSSNQTIDIAIVGSGPAGLYVAWRLLQLPQYIGMKLRLFDAANRVGGRVLSVELPSISYVAELGAMRYLSDQILLSSLVKHLDLISRPFVCETKGFFLRGKFVRAEAFKDRKDTDVGKLYSLESNEKGKDPFELIIVAIQRALRKTSIIGAEGKEEAKGVSIQDLVTKLEKLSISQPSQTLVKANKSGKIKPYFTAKEWRLIRRFGSIDNEPLRRYGFWDLVQRHLSTEAYNLAHDGSGYQSILNMWNAADAIVWYLADFANVPYLSIKGGMGKLVSTLQSEIEAKAATRQSTVDNTPVFSLGWNLTEISSDGSGSAHQLKFNVKNLSGQQRTEIVRAKTVILALPQPALKALTITGMTVPLTNTAESAESIPFVRLLEAVTANPLCKIFAIFEKTWWIEKDRTESAKPMSFKVFTDSPLRMLYYFGREHSNDTADSKNNACLLLAYSDSRFAEYWKRLDLMDNDEGHSHYSESFKASMNPEQWTKFCEMALDDYGTCDSFMVRVKEQLSSLTGINVPTPGTILFKHWSDPPSYVGWHSWNMGFKSWQIAEKMVKPFGPNVGVFTCGEAFSSEQGWIEGALKSAERVLKKMDVPLPDWIDKKKYEEQVDLWL